MAGTKRRADEIGLEEVITKPKLQQLLRQLTARQPLHEAVIMHTPNRYNARRHGGHDGQPAPLESTVRQVSR